MNIRKAAVLGAGTMGATIAAHLANAGIPTLLLDIAPRELTTDEEAKGLPLDSPQVKNRIANAGYAGLAKRARRPI
jgi:3-hydroxyacyl-CoA dehydrogenase